jgi:maltose alpha-D-glucosyltransferase/alpha-amylase
MTTLRSADPLWYKDAVFYQLHVKSFADSNADGIGDFPGLASKLDHLASLGVDCLWLQPMYPSPFKDDGYDISDYTSIHPGYGTQQEFETFLSQAHARGLRVIIELVLNHTSDQHAWFQEARSPSTIRVEIGTSDDTDDAIAGAYHLHRQVVELG